MSASVPDIPHPRHTAELIGQQGAEAVFLRAWRTGRVPHAWLLAGPRGVGKATLAYCIARFVLAGGEAAASGTAPIDLDMASDHPVFRRVASGGHADLLTVERGVNPRTGKPRTEIVVDDAREVGAFFHKTAAEGGWRVAVLDSIDAFNRNAANAVLKIVEEPPPRTLLLLVSHAPGRLLPTLRSRCSKLALAPLEDRQVMTIVHRLVPALKDSDAGELAALAEGSVGRALLLAAGDGLSIYRAFRDLASALPRADVAGLHAFGDRVARPGDADAFLMLEDLTNRFFSRAVRLSSGAANVDDDAALAQLARRASPEAWAQLSSESARLFRRADSVNLDRKQVVLSLFHGIGRAVGG